MTPEQRSAAVRVHIESALSVSRAITESQARLNRVIGSIVVFLAAPTFALLLFVLYN